MRDLVGVSESFWVHRAPPKQSLLLFDRILYPTPNWDDVVLRDWKVLEELESRGIISRFRFGLMEDKNIAVHAPFLQLTYDEEKSVTLRQICSYLCEHIQVDALPIEVTPITYATSYEASAAEVVRVVVNQLPVLSEENSWEALIDFRSDPDLGGHRLALRRWIRKMIREKISMSELQDEIEFLAHQYIEHVRLHRLKFSVGAFETVVVAGAELLENILHLKFGAAAKALFEVKRRRLDLLEAEMKAPGREIAYLVHAKERFAR